MSDPLDEYLEAAGIPPTAPQRVLAQRDGHNVVTTDRFAFLRDQLQPWQVRVGEMLTERVEWRILPGRGDRLEHQPTTNTLPTEYLTRPAGM